MRDWPEYTTAHLDAKPINVGQHNAMVRIRENPQGSYFLCGAFSRGKTYLLVAQFRRLALEGRKCILRSGRDLMEELRKAEMMPEQGSAPFESPVLQMISDETVGHLFIDDVEKAPARTQFRAEMLFDLFDTIKRRQLGLSLTSNLTLAETAALLGEAAHARLYALCEEIII